MISRRRVRHRGVGQFLATVALTNLSLLAACGYSKSGSSTTSSSASSSASSGSGGASTTCGFPPVADACVHDCEQMFPVGIDRDSAQNACAIDDCTTDCGLTCGFFQLSGSDPCNTCLRNMCCADAEACSKDQRCIDLFNCLQLSSGPNPDPATCFQMWGAKEIGAAVSMLNCAGTTCKNACGGPGCGLYASLAPQGCQSCISASCCAESSDCGLDPDCVALETCVSLCAGDAACVSKCRSSLPVGVPKFDVLAMCESTHCPACP